MKPIQARLSPIPYTSVSSEAFRSYKTTNNCDGTNSWTKVGIGTQPVLASMESREAVDGLLGRHNGPANLIKDAGPFNVNVKWPSSVYS